MVQRITPMEPLLMVAVPVEPVLPTVLSLRDRSSFSMILRHRHRAQQERPGWPILTSCSISSTQEKPLPIPSAWMVVQTEQLPAFHLPMFPTNGLYQIRVINVIRY